MREPPKAEVRRSRLLHRGYSPVMTDYIFLSTTAVAIILAGVAMLTMLLTFAIGVLGRPQRNYTVALFGCLALIWAGAILVIVLIKLQI